MTPELKTCLNYCDHGEGSGTEPYLPTLHGLIVNAVNAETTTLRTENEALKGQLCRAKAAFEKTTDHLADTFLWGKVRSALSSSSPCPHAARVKELEEQTDARVAQLEGAVEWAASTSLMNDNDISPLSRPGWRYAHELRRRAGK